MKKTKIPTVYTYYLYYRYPGMKEVVYDTYVTLNEAAGLGLKPGCDGVFLPGNITDERYHDARILYRLGLGQDPRE